MSTSDASQTTVAHTLAAETKRKRRLIRDSLWPRARLFAEILYHQLNADNTFSLASALAYKTLFSLIPVVVLSLLILSSISTKGGGANALDASVQRIMFEQLTLDKIPMLDDKGHAMTDGDGHQVMLSQFISPYIDKARRSLSTRSTLAGLVAFAILLYGALSLMIVIEGAFNMIYGAVPSRSWHRRLMLYWCVLTLGPIGVAVSIVLGNSAWDKATRYVGPLDWTLAPLQIIFSIFISFILVVLLYRIIPGTRVKWRSALLGGIVGAFLWELCKWCFGVYIHWSVKHPNWYGSLALLPLFMLWIYLIWCSILIGLHVAYMHQYYPLLKRRYFFTRMGRSALSDIRTILPLGALLYKKFLAGKTLHPADAAEALLLPTDAASQLLLCLQDAGIAHATRTGGYTLARPPESITAHDLLVAARALANVPPELLRQQAAAGLLPLKSLTDLESLESNWAKNHTLPTLA